MANKYEVTGFTYCNEKEGVTRHFPVNVAEWKPEFRDQLAVYGLALKAGADTASDKKLKGSGLTREQSLDIYWARMEEMVRLQTMARERVERPTAYVDQRFVAAIQKGMRMTAEAAMGSYVKSVLREVEPAFDARQLDPEEDKNPEVPRVSITKAQCAPIITGVLSRHPKIKAAYDAAKPATPSIEEGIEL